MCLRSIRARYDQRLPSNKGSFKREDFPKKTKPAANFRSGRVKIDYFSGYSNST
jgi:hypothetical protein